MDGILNSNDSNCLMNSINHYQFLEHNEKMNAIVAESEMVYTKTFGLIPYRDGNQWCVLLGENIQEGICGFGDTAIGAILDFNRNFLTEKA